MIRKGHYALTAIHESHKQVLFRNKSNLQKGVKTNFDLLFHVVDFLQVPFKFYLEDLKIIEKFDDNSQNVQLKFNDGFGYIKCFRVLKQENTLPNNESSIPMHNDDNSVSTIEDVEKLAQQITHLSPKEMISLIQSQNDGWERIL